MPYVPSLYSMSARLYGVLLRVMADLCESVRADRGSEKTNSGIYRSISLRMKKNEDRRGKQDFFFSTFEIGFSGKNESECRTV